MTMCKTVRNSEKSFFYDGFVKISEDFFWKAVDLINWSWLSSNKCGVNKDMYKYKLLKSYEVPIWKAVKEKQKDKYNALREMLRTYDTSWRVGTSDDRTWDLCAHVVGLGRKEYLKAFSDPESLVRRGLKRDFVENFGYWIPDTDELNLPNSVDFINKED